MKLDADDIRELQPVIAAVVHEVLDAIDADRDRLAYPQREAAALLGVAPSVLRDARLRGELSGTKIGKRVCYSRAELIRFLTDRRIER